MQRERSPNNTTNVSMATKIPASSKSTRQRIHCAGIIAKAPTRQMHPGHDTMKLKRAEKGILGPCYETIHLFFLFLGRPAALLNSMSPSANHRLALANCTTLRICLKNMTGKLIPARIQGTVESILFARASSSAPALQGLANMNDAGGDAGFPG